MQIGGRECDGGQLSVSAAKGAIRPVLGAQRLPALLTARVDAGVVAQSIRVVEPNLEDVFLHLTGRALRD